MRRIITYSTLGDNMKEVFSAAMTWGDLQADLTRANVRFEGMKAMTNPGQVTLESLQAELPEGEFQLFIMPQKVKSGSDNELIDEEEGIGWADVDWTEEGEFPEDYVFATHKDLAIARAKKAFGLLQKAIDYLSGIRAINKSTTQASTGDPILASLREEAAKLQRNMEVFG